MKIKEIECPYCKGIGCWCCGATGIIKEYHMIENEERAVMSKIYIPFFTDIYNWYKESVEHEKQMKIFYSNYANSILQVAYGYDLEKLLSQIECFNEAMEI